MAILKNELSWSRTRATTFNECRRRYFFQYYLKWNGWDSDAPAERRIAYRLSQMTCLPLLAGLAAHEAIRLLLETVRGRATLEGPPEEYAANYMRRVWTDARAQRWLTRPKQYPPVFELYYQDGVAREELVRFGEISRRAVRNFAASPLFAELRESDTKAWLAVDDPIDFNSPDVFTIDGCRVWARPDFARQAGDRCVIFDWKTGSQKPEDRTQILSYALHARDRWKFPADRIDAVAVYLGDGVEQVRFDVDDEALAEVTDLIRSDLGHLKTLEARSNDETAFPTVDDPRACAQCFFQEICPAVKAVPMHLRGSTTSS